MTCFPPFVPVFTRIVLSLPLRLSPFFLHRRYVRDRKFFFSVLVTLPLLYITYPLPCLCFRGKKRFHAFLPCFWCVYVCVLRMDDEVVTGSR